MNIDYCYHTHTSRCGHAKGTDEEIVISAINQGVKVLGFSDHIPFPNFSQQGIRMEYSQLSDYLQSIKYLKEKYKDQIEIHCGFEGEYAPDYFPYYKSLLENDIEYLILGNHWRFDKGGKKTVYFALDNQPEGAYQYAKDLIKGMKSGLFSYVAHPDLYVTVYDEFDEDCKKIAHMICKASIKYHIPLEINLGGLRSKWIEHMKYANEGFWKIAGEYGCEVFIGVDAHSPDSFPLSNYEHAFNLITKNNLKLLTRLPLKK